MIFVLKLFFFSLDRLLHSNIFNISFFSVARLLVALIFVQYNTISSAYNTHLDWISKFTTSSINSKKNRGPKVDPCGTP